MAGKCIRMRWKAYVWMAVLSITAVLCGCSQRKAVTDYAMSDVKAESLSGNEASVAGTEVMPETEERAAEEAYQGLLASCMEFYGEQYALDVTFLEWLAEEYGDSCILELADAAESHTLDTDVWRRLTGNTIHVLWLLFCEQTGRKDDRLNAVTWKDCAATEETTLAFTGDINFAEGYVTTRYLDSCADGIYGCFSKDLLTLMNGMDVMMINNEFTYSDRGQALSGKAFTFRADPSRAELLHVFGTDIVNLANNHVYDFGPDALLDTIATLDQEGIPHIGAGANLREASQPYAFICNGWKITLAAATQIERSKNYTKEATADTPGVLKTLNPEKYVEVIRKAKQTSDYVIAVVHWGTEGDSYYGPDQEELAQAFVEAGADAVIGGHTHCLQGFEIIDGVPVLYSLGNFWFSKKTQDTGIAKITIDAKGELSLSFIPCIQEGIRTSLVSDETQKQRILDFLQEHSAAGVRLTADGVIQQEE